MRIVLYTHSLVSDWNHGNAHFLRGILSELAARGHDTIALEPVGGWSRANLLADAGPPALDRFATDFPELTVRTYDGIEGHEAHLDGADLVIVHEWTDPALVAHLGRLRRDARFTLLFHDTHHRAVSDETAISSLALDGYDAVLAFGETLSDRYRRLGWGRRVFTWHEAADTRRFHPMSHPDRRGLVWIGNWGDGERARELDAFLIEPATALDLAGTVHGVRYPAHALDRFARSPLRYRGWIANADVPRAFAAHAVTLHVPRRPYVAALPGIPTIRVFEALACGIPLISAPWTDAEALFRPGDFLTAADGTAMQAHLHAVTHDPDLARATAARGLETILARHTCGHRVDELLSILGKLGHRIA